MNLSYFRRSSFSMDETIERLKQRAEADGFSVLGETSLPDSGARVVYACKSRWADALIAQSPSLFGLLPCAVVVYEKDGRIMIGAGSPSVLGGVSDSAAIQELASAAELGVRKLIDEAAGAGALKPSGVRLYSTKSCPYCRMEKSWLDSRKVRYDLIYVDEDQDSEFILGFDQAKLARILA